MIVAFAFGIAFEHVAGVRDLIDATGLRDWIIVNQFRSTTGRTPVPLSTATQGRVMIALVFGQSNAGNAGESRMPSQRGVYEYYRGRIFEARDPLLGASGDGGSIWLRLAGKLVAHGDYDSVVLVPFAIGSSEIAKWAPGGSLAAELSRTVADARSAGLTFTHLLWLQGEADAMMHTSAQSYRERFTAMLAALRRGGVDAPIFVARASRCAKFRPSDEIRGAQAALVDPDRAIFAGPDTDTLGFAERYDGCHFSAEGLDHAAQLWIEAIDGAHLPATRP